MWENFRNALNKMRVVDNSWSEGEMIIAQPGRPKKGAIHRLPVTRIAKSQV